MWVRHRGAGLAAVVDDCLGVTNLSGGSVLGEPVA